MNHGDSCKRIDLAILGDGYIEADLGKDGQYDIDAKKIMSDFFGDETSFATDPGEDVFREYRNYFNVLRVDVPSDDSGITLTNGGVSSPKYTALSTTRSGGRIYYVVPQNYQMWRDANLNICQRDIQLVLANDRPDALGDFGTGGDPTADLVPAIVGPERIAAVYLHEIAGHYFGRLADEYTHDPAAWIFYLCGPQNSEQEPKSRNVTRKTSLSEVKWKAWIPEGTEIPTGIPTGGTSLAQIGLYRGGCGVGPVCQGGINPGQLCDGDGNCPGGECRQVSIFRPAFNTRMRSLDQPFSPVDLEWFIKRIYDHDLATCSPAPCRLEPTATPENSATPTPTPTPPTDPIAISCGSPVTFTIEMPAPMTHDLTAKWTLDGVQIPSVPGVRSTNGTTVSFSFSSTQIPPGAHSLTVKVTDDGKFVANYPHCPTPGPFPSEADKCRFVRDEEIGDLLFKSATWNVQVASGCPLISGHITYDDGPYPVEGVLMNVGGHASGANITDTWGSFTINGLSNHAWSVEPTLNRTATTSSSLLFTPVDASFALQIAAGVITPSADQLLACDANGNGSISGADANEILNRVVGLQPTLPAWTKCQSWWAFTPVPAPGSNVQITPPHFGASSCQRGRITYSSLSTSALEQDFTGVLVGDCNLSWHPSAGEAVCGNARLGNLDDPMFRMRGRSPWFPVYVDAATPFQAVQFELSYDSSKLQRPQVKRGKLVKTARRRGNSNYPGNYRVAWTTRRAISAPTEPLLYIRFKKLPPGVTLDENSVHITSELVLGDAN